MDASHPLYVSLSDALSEVTRKERRMLLGVSALAIFVARTGSVPEEITTLGLKFEAAQQQAFVTIFALVVLYFALAFLVYGAADFIKWRLILNEGSKESVKQLMKRAQPNAIRASMSDYVPEGWVSTWPNHFAFPIGTLRGIFDFLLPLAVGSYATYELLSIR